MLEITPAESKSNEMDDGETAFLEFMKGEVVADDYSFEAAPADGDMAYLEERVDVSSSDDSSEGTPVVDDDDDDDTSCDAYADGGETSREAPVNAAYMAEVKAFADELNLVRMDPLDLYNSRPDALHWSAHNVFQLIAAWTEQSGNNRRKMKHLWQNIADDIATAHFKPTWMQVETKWKGLLRTHKRLSQKSDGSCLYTDLVFNVLIGIFFHRQRNTLEFHGCND